MFIVSNILFILCVDKIVCVILVSLPTFFVLILPEPLIVDSSETIQLEPIDTKF